MYLEAAQIFSAADACRGDIAGIGNEPTHQEFIASQGSAIYGPICDKLSMRNELYTVWGLQSKSSSGGTAAGRFELLVANCFFWPPSSLAECVIAGL